MAQTIRERRLKADHQRVTDLIGRSDLLEIVKTEGVPPESYVVLYRCRGITSLHASGPCFADAHRVEILLPRDYPLDRPQLRCLTPVFHPNIDRNGAVCTDLWYAGRFLDELVVMVGRMIRYQNYNPASPLNEEAAEWAVSHRSLFPIDVRPFCRGRSDEGPPMDSASVWLGESQWS
jgi:ubiquitin-protein ligase